MKFTMSWLKDHLDTDASVQEIADALTMLGLEIEEVVDRSAGLESFVTARVVTAEPHPNADKLRVCTVDNGTETFGVVCGAPNARAGMVGVFAASGAYIPGTGITLKKAAIRGVESNGMLLSEREMGISDDHTGIVDLPADTPIGQPAVAALGLDDVLIDIAITPNRGDCLGVRGVARDLAAAGMGTLKPLAAEPVPGAFASPVAVNLNLPEGARDACPYFVGRYIRGVKNGPSPQWVQDRLRAVGLRPISALVDITNLMTLEYGRPLHVFDAAKVTGNVQARLATPGETLLALDGKEYTLDGEMTVIADDARAEAIAGVMGGEESGCTEATTDVFLECAWFDPIRTAMTGRKLQLQSDARYRFERGIDAAFMVDGTEIATRLILDFCGGEASHLVIAGAEPAWQRSIAFRPARVAALGGADVPEDEIRRILSVLGFGITGDGDSLSVSVPAWRNDIVGEADLVEEVVRVFGYDNIPAVAMERQTDLPVVVLTLAQQRRSRVRRLLATRGLVEAVTYSFMPAERARLFGGGQESVILVNPISADLDVMRPSILPNLMADAGRNADRGVADAALFEIGPQYAGDAPEDQVMVAAAVRSGRTGHRNWAQAPRPVDVFDAKADALAALDAAGAPVDKLQVFAEAPAWYHPGRSGTLRLGPKTVLAAFGEVHPRILKALDVKGPMAAVEVFLDAVPEPKAAKSAARPHLELPNLQPVERDFAFVVGRDVPAAKVIAAARSADKGLIVDVRVFDLFAGGSLGADEKSLAVNVVLQPLEKTLTDADLEALSGKVVASVEKATGGRLRA
ncbi:MAG: phenylalanine--tRNA ligase subunit beta [Rhodobacterales bacterium]|nr:phenylalanine--tRNA ligase subunit beta [Rhodobacterales bacterium]